MSIISRYIVAQYLRIFALCLAAGTSLFVVIDFFSRIGNLFVYEPSVASVAGYFLFKLPRVIADVYPAAALMAVFLAIGMLSRHREILALMACGMSTFQMVAPLLLASALLSCGFLVWNETVVPAASTRSHLINDIGIKRKDHHGRFDANGLWIYDRHGFLNVDYFDAKNSSLYGLTLYEASPSFRLNRIIGIPKAQWENGAWQISDGVVKNLGPDGEILLRPLQAGEFELSTKPQEFSQRRRSTHEFSYGALARQIAVVRRMGLDVSTLLVDLYAKIAWPFSGLVTVFLGFPLAIRGGYRAGVAYNLTLGMVIGFGYWITVALAAAAGHRGGIPPLAAAWTANALFAVLGALAYLDIDTRA